MGAVDFFLKIDGIDGESSDAKHKDEIDVLSWSWQESQVGINRVTGKGRGAGKVSVEDFVFHMHTNKASANLFLACANGKHIPKAVLVARKAGEKPVEYLKITLSDILVSKYEIGGATSDTNLPVDSISLNFGKIEWEYKPQGKDGTAGAPVSAGWNVIENIKV